MPVLKAQVTFDRASGLPADRVVNTFSFGAPSGSRSVLEGIAGVIAGNLQTFYDHVYAATGAMVGYLSPSLKTGVGGADNGTRTIRFYDLSDAVPRVPLFEVVDHPGIGAAAAALPDEVAICLSFQALRTSGLDQARRRGRIFFGPLNGGASDAAATGPRPSAAFKTVAIAAMSALAAASAAAADWTWGVYSEPFAGRPETARSGRSTLPALPARGGTFAPVHDVWVDNAFDTQRRRGLAPTVKTTAVANAANAVVLGA